MSLAARRAQQYLRRPPPPRWLRPTLRATGAGLGLALGVGLGIWASQAGLFADLRAAALERAVALSSAAGLVVREVYVEGRLRTSTDALRARLGVQLGDPILGLDTDALRTRLEGLTWIARASVERLLPQTLEIRLIERRPLALWQRAGRFALIDQTGAVIEGAFSEAEPPEPYRRLRVLVGDHAPGQAPALFALLATEPALARRVVAATWVGDRRWSLVLDNRIEVLLPERDPQAAWRLLAAKARDEALLARAITVVDLRLLPERRLRLQLDPRLLEDRDA